jgi:hypothetical protein
MSDKLKISECRRTVTIKTPEGQEIEVVVVVAQSDDGCSEVSIGGDAVLRYDREGNLENPDDPDPHLCNLCGESVLIDGHPYGLIDQSVSGGWKSIGLGDCEWRKFSLCEFCLDDLFLRMVVPPRAGSFAGSHPGYHRPREQELRRYPGSRSLELFLAEQKKRTRSRAKVQGRLYNPIEQLCENFLARGFHARVFQVPRGPSGWWGCNVQKDGSPGFVVVWTIAEGFVIWSEEEWPDGGGEALAVAQSVEGVEEYLVARSSSPSEEPSD